MPRQGDLHGEYNFSGPIRSESTLKTISKNSTTGVITEVITMGDAPVALGDEDKTLDNAHIVEEF